MGSVPRRLVVIGAITTVPLALLVVVEAHSGFLRVMAVAWAALGLVLGWLATRSLSRRIGDLKVFAEALPDLRGPKPTLPVGDDELGELARALSRMVPRIDELLGELRTELARREAILGNMTEAVVAVDARLNISFCNSSFAKMVASHSVAAGVPLLKVVRDPGLFQLLQRVIASGETARHRLKIGGQGERTYDAYATPLGAGPSPGALSILYDVTPMERLERTKRDFVANVSHEFRTPLATITGYAETLLNGGLEDHENRRKFVEIIQANSVRLNNIAADLITLSELEGGIAGPPGPVSVDEVVHSALNTIEPVARMREVSLRVENGSGLEVLGHRFRLEQALLNLLDNAVKFNKSAGQVCVKVSLAGDDQVEITISDTGIGIPPEDLSRIFERFYRVDKARSRQVGGTGLGLSIVRHAVEQMHGTVKVESELGRGACFTIRLPRYRRA
ncbi:MAG: hypothetical protein C5B51_18620 [Terriglobia bacterium]|nr:MAG: hypothetical protein C5B51_18620 [Terriglobia bacterium]